MRYNDRTAQRIIARYAVRTIKLHTRVTVIYYSSWLDQPGAPRVKVAMSCYRLAYLIHRAYDRLSNCVLGTYARFFIPQNYWLWEKIKLKIQLLKNLRQFRGSLLNNSLAYDLSNDMVPTHCQKQLIQITGIFRQWGGKLFGIGE